MSRILLVEDDPRISDPLIRVLATEGFTVRHVADGASALAAVDAERPDLVLLDLTLPDVDGLDICRTLRQRSADLPIIMLTARADEMDVIVGFDAGADDYIAKPFRLAELIARLRSRLRVAHAGAEHPQVLASDAIRVDVEARRAFVDGDEVDLTTKEFDLLCMLMRRRDTAVAREQIMSEIWGDQASGSSRTLDTHISTLRRKIRDDHDPPRIIVTVRGVGFRFEGTD